MACSNYCNKKSIRQIRESQQRAIQYHHAHQQNLQQQEAEYKRWQSEQQIIRRMELARNAQQIEATSLTDGQIRQINYVVQEQLHANEVNLVSVAITMSVIAHAATVGFQGLFEAIGNVIALHVLNRE